LIVASLEEHKVPPALVDEIQESLCRKSIFLSSVYALGCSAAKFSSRTVHEIAKKRILPGPVGVPRPILRFLISNLTSSIHTLNMNGVYFTDDLVATLAASNAAKSLRRLNVSENLLTDDSSLLWSSFEHLEDLDVSGLHFASRVTLQALAKMPNLQHIKIGTCGRCKTNVDALIFLQPEAVPYLRSLQGFDTPWASFEEQDLFIESIIECLKRRPNLDLLEEISVGLRNRYETGVAQSLLLLLPNLQRSPFPFSSWSDVECCNLFNLTKLDLQESDVLITAATLASVRTRLRRLRVWNISSCAFEIKEGEETFLLFDQLETLSLDCCEFVPSTMRLPSSLRVLQLHRVHFVSPEGISLAQKNEDSLRCVSALVQTIASDAPHLERVEFLHSCYITAEIVQKFYDALPNAIECNVTTYDEDCKQSCVRIRHRNIQTVSAGLSFSEFPIELEKAPSLACVDISFSGGLACNLTGANSVNSTTSPNLVRLKIAYDDFENSNGMAFVEPVVDSLISCHSLEILESSGVLAGRDLTRLSALTRLQSLRLERIQHIDFLNLAPSFSNLVSLNLFQCEVENFSTMSLPWLQMLTLTHIQMIQPLVLDPSLLPSIEQLQFYHVDTPAFSAIGHKNLFIVNYQTATETSSVEFSDCPSLVSLSLSGIFGCNSIVVKDNSKLRVLRLMANQFTHQTSISISCPRLEDLHLHSGAKWSAFMLQLCDRLINAAGVNFRKYVRNTD
jgi:hypothetical protein